MNNIIEYIQKHEIMKIVLIVVGIYILYTFITKKTEKLDNVVPVPAIVPITMVAAPSDPSVQTAVTNPVVTPSAQQAQINQIVAGTNKITAADLLPVYDAENKFAKENPVSKLLQEQNFLISGHQSGINTVMQTNKIGNLDIRSVVPILKESVGPFLNSSYEQNGFRRGFELN